MCAASEPLPHSLTPSQVPTADILLKLLDIHNVAGVRSDVIRLTAVYVSHSLKDLRDDTLSSETSIVGVWLRLIDQYSEPSQIVAVRSGVITAIDESRLLIGTNEMRSSSSPLRLRAEVTVWLVAVRLLQDDDADVREACAELVSRVLCPEHGPMVVSHAVELVFETMTSRFGGSSPEYVTFLVDLIGVATDRPEDAFASCDVNSESMGKQFEKESDNFHAEDAFLVRLASQHLARILSAPPHDVTVDQWPLPNGSNPLLKCDGVLAWSRIWLRYFGAKVRQCVELMGPSLSATWIGGVSYHREVFLLLFRIINGLSAFAAAASSTRPGEGEDYKELPIASAVQQTHSLAEADDGSNTVSLKGIADSVRELLELDIHPILKHSLSRTLASLGVTDKHVQPLSGVPEFLLVYTPSDK
mmetsp:Transcript_36847/g.59598  ORF Transcript_36847/g.59598 Transcript_36847/m.59598 type:complete len:416 (+) Transcript_36847:160-1407(+)